MLAKDADKLKVGDKVVTFNGPYIQHGFVTGVTRGKGSIRWIEYKWRPPGTLEWKFGCKRHVSVHFPRKDRTEAGTSNLLGPIAAIVLGVALTPLIIRFLGQPIIWQDVVLMVGGFILAPALVISIARKVKLPVLTTLPTALALTAFVVVYATLELYLAVVATTFTAICWYILFFRRNLKGGL